MYKMSVQSMKLNKNQATYSENSSVSINVAQCNSAAKYSKIISKKFEAQILTMC